MPGTWVTRCYRCGATASASPLVRMMLRPPGQLARTVYRCDDAAACTERRQRR
jgi:hypothetical protein